MDQVRPMGWDIPIPRVLGPANFDTLRPFIKALGVGGPCALGERMNKLVVMVRVLMGLPLLTLGLNGFLDFMEPPLELPLEGLSLLRSLRDAEYIVPLMHGTMIFSGVLLVSGFFVPLGLVAMAPLIVNFACVHIFLDDPKNGVVAYVLAGLELFLVVAYGSYFKGFFQPKSKSRFQ